MRSIAQTLDLAIRCAVTAQKKNKFGGWRYSPDATDSDTSVTGAVLMGLLAARNAGMDVPDDTINAAMEYERRSTGGDGSVAYSGGFGGMGGSMNLTAVAACGRRRVEVERDGPVQGLPQAPDRPISIITRAATTRNTFGITWPRRFSRAITMPGKNGTPRRSGISRHAKGRRFFRRLLRDGNVAAGSRPQLPFPSHLRAMKKRVLILLLMLPAIGCGADSVEFDFHKPSYFRLRFLLQPGRRALLRQPLVTDGRA